MSRKRATGLRWLGNGENQRKWTIDYLQKTMLPKLRDTGLGAGSPWDLIQRLDSYSSKTNLLKVGDSLERDDRWRVELRQMKAAWHTWKSRQCSVDTEVYSLTLPQGIKRKIKSRAKNEGISEAEFVTWLVTEEQNSNRKEKERNKKLIENNNKLVKKNTRAENYLESFKSAIQEQITLLLIPAYEQQEIESNHHIPGEHILDSRKDKIKLKAEKDAEAIIKKALPKKHLLDKMPRGPVGRENYIIN